MSDTPHTHWTKVHDTLCAHGTSPFWHPREERLYWLDAGLRRLWRVHPRSDVVEHLDLPQEPGSVVPCQKGGLLLAMRDGIYHLGSWSDLPRQVRPAPYDTSRQHFGEGRCDPWGRFWVGTRVDALDRADGALYCLQTRTQAQPELQLMERGALSSAGLAWSLDGRALYWADASRHDIASHAMTQPGRWPPVLGVPMPWARFPRKPEGWSFDHRQGYEGRPGGAALDQEGRYWVAMQDGGQVLCLGERGDIVARYPLPAQCPTSLCFGGADGKTLFVTTSRLHRGEAELRYYPDSGAVFSMPVSSAGQPAHLYWD